jgi:hypothetical protein
MSGQSGSTFGGTGIVGVSPVSPKQSILIYHKQDHYNKWQFVYNPLNDPSLQQQGGSSAGVGTPASQMNGSGTTGATPSASGFGGSSFGTGSSSPGGFGSSSPGGFGSSPSSAPTQPQQ